MSESIKRRLEKIAKHVQAIVVEDTCFDHFLNVLDESKIEQTYDTLEVLMSYVKERLEDIAKKERASRGFCW